MSSGSTDDTRRRIRQYRDADEGEVVAVWHRSGIAAYPYLPMFQALTLEEAHTVFRDVIRARCAIWVGTLDERIVAYLAMNGSYIDRLYVDPSAWRTGWGTRFIRFAKQLSPGGLELHTHQENHAARALYERHGFEAVQFGVSPPPESVPDVEYHWRPVPSGSDRPAGRALN
jgi:GNAT superfamily N-acetyltransferase